MPENGLEERTVEESSVSEPRDRVTFALFVAVGVAVVAVLGLVGFVLYYGLKPQPPRTAAELQIETLLGVTKSNPKDAKSWALLADAYVNAGKYDDAADTIRQAHDALGGDRGDLLVEDGRMLIAQNRLDEAVKSLKRAVQLGESERQAKIAENKKKDVVAPIPSSAVNNGQVLLGDIYFQQKRYEDAVKAFTAGLKEDPNMADVLVFRGNAYAALKRVKEASADYQRAMTFIPGYQPAQQGLEKLKAVGK